MTNCGAAGWVTDRSGYRYDACDPLTGNRVYMPGIFSDLCGAPRPFGDSATSSLMPPLTLRPGAPDSHQKMSAITRPHRIGVARLPAVFLFGLRRKDRPQRMCLESGDVAVCGLTRLAYHGEGRWRWRRPVDGHR